MARLISLVEACCMCLNENQWRRGCRNVSHNRSLGNFLFFELSKLHFRSSHSSARKVSGAVRSYSSNMPDGSDFTEKLSLFMGYDGIQELIEPGEGQQRCELDISCLDLELACNEFSSITLGDSTSIQLYDNASLNEQMSILLEESWNKCLPNPVYHYPNKSKNLHDACSSSESSLSNAFFSSDAESLDNYLVVTGVTPSKDEVALDLSFTKETSASSNYVHSDVSASTEIFLDKSIRSILGISARRYGQLENSGFHTVRKLLNHYPRTYADLQNVQSAIDDGQYLILVGTVLSSRGIQAGFSLSFLEVIVGCEFAKAEETSEGRNEDSFSGDKKTIFLHLKKFFSGSRFTTKPFLQSIQSKYNEGDRVYVSGKVKKMHASDHYEMREYTVDMLEEGEEVDTHLQRRPYPLYPSKAGLKAGLLRDIILRVLKVLPIDIDPIPDCILKEFNLPGLQSAYFGIHRPKDIIEADLARRRLIFDEFFYLQLARLFQMLEALGTRGEKEGLLDKYQNQQCNAVSLDEWSELTKKFLEALPYSLTPSQLNAVSEIIWDLKRPVPMNRLLQGDVGCGKTVVAFLACMEVIGCGFQAAFMVPTELLAIQHYEQLLSLLENISDVQQKPSVALLTGSTSTKQSRIIRQGLQNGEIAIVVGTHSLIAEKVEFSALRIAVVDEQHRFGVVQRGRFNSKLYSAPMKINSMVVDESSTEGTDERLYMAPHVLAMSATPIPRTLALALYGDMSLTQITDLPPGRVSVETLALEGNKHGFEKVYQMMRDELVGGGKVYLVYPVIEESEQLPQLRAVASDSECISAKFKDYQCGILHGRMKSEEKDEALRMFRAGEIRILLATQVIEIGIDIPDASMMVVMNAEKFGTAQLHQLRGRVGRGEKQSKCVFLSSTAATLGRLKVLEQSSDGFLLANVDLMLRGPGNLLGKKQSGHRPDFPIARLEIDGNILQEAHVAALKILSASSDLDKFPRLKAELSMRQPLCLLGD